VRRGSKLEENRLLADTAGLSSEQSSRSRRCNLSGRAFAQNDLRTLSLAWASHLPRIAKLATDTSDAELHRIASGLRGCRQKARSRFSNERTAPHAVQPSGIARFNRKSPNVHAPREAKAKPLRRFSIYRACKVEDMSLKF